MVSWLIGATGQLLTPHSFRSRPISPEEPIECRPLERARRPVDSALVDTQLDVVAEPAEGRTVAERDVLEPEDGVVGAGPRGGGWAEVGRRERLGADD